MSSILDGVNDKNFSSVYKKFEVFDPDMMDDHNNSLNFAMTTSVFLDSTHPTLLNRTVCGAFVGDDVDIAPGLTDQLNSQGWEIALLVLYLLIGVSSIIGNLLIIVSVAVAEKLRKPTNYFISSLAVSDLLIGIGITIDCIMYPLWGRMCKHAYQVCVSLTTLNNIAMVVSPLNLMAIAYDRYKYITSPLTYHLNVGNRKVFALIVTAWIYSVIIGLIPVFPGDLTNVAQQSSIHKSCLVYRIYPKLYLFFLMYGHLYVSFAITCVFYIQIFKKALHQSKVIHKQITVTEDGAMSWKSRRKALFQTGAWRVTKMTVIVLVSVFVLWSPHTSLITYLILCNNCKVAYSVYAVTLILYYFNCCNNMFIYAWRSPEFRKTFKYFLKCGRR